MSRFVIGVSAALALSLMSGAAELARGRDLSTAAGTVSTAVVTASFAPLARARFPSRGDLADGASPVNRSSKADRVAPLAGSPASTQTISVKLQSFSDTTFLVRIPVATVITPAAAPAPAKPAMRNKPMVACEPVVSPLTEVAKRLEPGRCVT
jgi:hypothetical protein